MLIDFLHYKDKAFSSSKAKLGDCTGNLFFILMLITTLLILIHSQSKGHKH